MNWLQKIATEDLVHEFRRRWDEIKQLKDTTMQGLMKQNPPDTYYDQIRQDAEVSTQTLPLYESLVQWMASQASLIQDPQLAERWNSQMTSIQENMTMYREQIVSSQAPWNPNDHNLEEVLEWYADNGIDIRPVLAEFGVNYEEVEFPKAKVLVFSTDATYVYEDGSIMEAHEWVNNAEPLEYYESEPDDDFWQHNLQGFVLYHATPNENVESIMREGLNPMNRTRGIANRSTGSAVFTSDNPDDIDSYGEVVIAIDVGAMQADGYTPAVAQEEPIEEQNLKGNLAHQLGLEDYSWDVESGISETTYIFYDSIPPKYLRVE